MNQTKVYHIVAVANNRVIGKENKLPWHFSSDLKYFKHLTTGQTVLMGRKTYESIGKPLPHRENFILSRSPSFKAEGCHVFLDLESALKHVQTKICFIIGGASLYKETLQDVDGIYLNQIHASFPGDAYYPLVPDHFVEKTKETLQENPLIEAFFLENTKKEITK